MKTLRRFDFSNCEYFLTIVTYNREALLLDDPDMFWASWSGINPSAWVIMPDHLHLLIDSGDNAVTNLVRRFKTRYSARYRMKYRDGRVWQNRFWDHFIRDQEDLNRHLDYIHFNPVKHGLAPTAEAWEYSSFRQYVKEGYYQVDWGQLDAPRLDGEYGE